MKGKTSSIGPSHPSKDAMADVVSLAAAVEVLHSASLVHASRRYSGGRLPLKHGKLMEILVL